MLAYRPNGCVVGCMTQYDFVNQDVAREGRDGATRDIILATIAFGHLAAPPQGQINVRPVIIARASGVPEAIAGDCIELVNEIGGSESGFRVADFLREYSDFDPQRDPLAIIVDRPPEVHDVPYRDNDGALRCPVCGEINCGWLAEKVRNAS